MLTLITSLIGLVQWHYLLQLMNGWILNVDLKLLLIMMVNLMLWYKHYNLNLVLYGVHGQQTGQVAVVIGTINILQVVGKAQEIHIEREVLGQEFG